MRIRRRLPLPPISSSPPPPPPPPPQIPDPSPFQLRPPNKGEETKEKGVGGGGGEGLHPVGDLQIEPHGWMMDPINRDPSPSGRHPTIGRSKQGSSNPSFFPPTLSHAKVLKEAKEEEMVEDSNKRWNAQVNSNKRIGSSSGALVSEEAAALLPKKRGGGGGGDDDNGNTAYGRREEKPVGKEKTLKSKARAKASSQVENHCTTVNGGENKRDEVVVMANGNVGSNGKKRRSPAVLMEGSRCSRVNGRGWRCCQQTLVGYSLCEHHLGKGRLRSMSGVRVQAGGGKPKKITEGGADGLVALLSSSSSPQEEEKVAIDVKQCSGVDNGEEDKEEEKQQVKKRRKKIGMVKARTISSLLDETNNSLQSTLSPSPSPPPEPAPMQSVDEGETIV